jgi:hypothetical protein
MIENKTDQKKAKGVQWEGETGLTVLQVMVDGTDDADVRNVAILIRKKYFGGTGMKNLKTLENFTCISGKKVLYSFLNCLKGVFCMPICSKRWKGGPS